MRSAGAGDATASADAAAASPGRRRPTSPVRPPTSRWPPGRPRGAAAKMASVLEDLLPIILLAPADAAAASPVSSDARAGLSHARQDSLVRRRPKSPVRPPTSRWQPGRRRGATADTALTMMDHALTMEHTMMNAMEECPWTEMHAARDEVQPRRRCCAGSPCAWRASPSLCARHASRMPPQCHESEPCDCAYSRGSLLSPHDNGAREAGLLVKSAATGAVAPCAARLPALDGEECAMADGPCDPVRLRLQAVNERLEQKTLRLARRESDSLLRQLYCQRGDASEVLAARYKKAWGIQP